MAELGGPGTPEDQGWLRENLREAIDHLVEMGYTVRGGQGEDPELIHPGGSAVQTWREDYPYEQRMSREEYELEKYRLQVELLKFQYWGQDQELRHVIVFEGRDAAGKGGTIKRFTEHLNPRSARAVALSKPSDRELGQWYFQRYIQHLPTAGEIVMFDRSWYNRANVERVMGFCTEQEYDTFMVQAPLFERMLVDSGIHLTKFWFSVTRRAAHPLCDPADRPGAALEALAHRSASLDRWEEYTDAKEETFLRTDTDHAPWITIKSNDKKRGRINAMRFFLNQFDYEDKDITVVHGPDRLIVRRGRDAAGDYHHPVPQRPAGASPREMACLLRFAKGRCACRAHLGPSGRCNTPIFGSCNDRAVVNGKVAGAGILSGPEEDQILAGAEGRVPCRPGPGRERVGCRAGTGFEAEHGQVLGGPGRDRVRAAGHRTARGVFAAARVRFHPPRGGPRGGRLPDHGRGLGRRDPQVQRPPFLPRRVQCRLQTRGEHPRFGPRHRRGRTGSRAGRASGPDQRPLPFPARTRTDPGPARIRGLGAGHRPGPGAAGLHGRPRDRPQPHRGRLPALRGAPGRRGPPAPPQGPETGGRGPAAGLRAGAPVRTLVPGGDQQPAGQGLPREPGDAREPRDDLPGPLRPGPRRAQARGRRGPAHRPDPPQNPPRPGPAHAPVRGPDGHDLRTPSRDRGPGRARALGRGPDHRGPQPLRDRDPGRTHHPVRDARPPAGRGPRRRGRARRTRSRPWAPCRSTCAAP